MKRSPAAVHRDAIGLGQFGGGGRTIIAAVACGAVAGDGGDQAGGVIHLADLVVRNVGDEKVPGGVHRDAVGSFSSAAVADRYRRCSLRCRCRRRW